jgi:hypothetical protein
MFKFIKTWYENKLDKKYNNKAVAIPQFDFKYPPPSAYEIKQLTEELGLKNYPSRKIWERQAYNINKEI